MPRDIKAGGAYVDLMLRDKKFRNALSSSGRYLKSFAKSAALAGAAVGAAAIGGIAVGIRAYMRMGDELDKMAARTGLSVEALSELKHAATQSGTDLAAVEKGVRRMQKSLVDAQSGLQTSRDAFENLGLSVEQLGKMTPEEQFTAVTEALADVEDATLRAGLAQNVLGKSGAALLPMVENVRSLRQEARDMGLTMSTEAASGAARLTDLFSIAGRQIKNMVFEVGAAAAPFVEKLLPVIIDFGARAIDAIRSAGDIIVANTDWVVSMLATYWNAVWETYSTVFATFPEIASAAWSAVAGSTGNAMEWMFNTVNETLGLVTALFQNWRGIVETATVSSQLSVVRFGNQLAYWFGTVIPEWLSWFSQNWYDVFTDVVNITATVAGNIWQNLVNLWNGIVGLFSGEGFSFEWTPLTEGFESAIKELPQIAEREMGPVEKELQQQLDNLATDLVNNVAASRKEFADKIQFDAGKLDLKTPSTAKRPGEADGSEFEALGAASRQKRIFSTFSVAAAQLQGQGGGQDRTQKDQLSVLKVIAKHAEKTARKKPTAAYT